MTNIQIGAQYGRLKITSGPHSHRTASGQMVRKYTARCECGRVKTFWASNLRAGHAKSCGCRRIRVITNVALAKSRPETRKLYDAWHPKDGLRTLFPKFADWVQYAKLQGYVQGWRIYRSSPEKPWALDNLVISATLPPRIGANARMVVEWQGERKSLRSWAKDPRVVWSHSTLYSRLKADPGISAERLLGPSGHTKEGTT